jgi:hypothetical protein
VSIIDKLAGSKTFFIKKWIKRAILDNGTKYETLLKFVEDHDTLLDYYTDVKTILDTKDLDRLISLE